MPVFIVEDLETGEKGSVGSLSGMSVKDAVSAISRYDLFRMRRHDLRRAPFANTREDLDLAYALKRISKSTYYRRRRQLEHEQELG